MTIEARNQELLQINKVVQTYQQTKQSTGLYLCGVPGSGKTYTITHALNHLTHLYLNCSMFKTKKSIYKAISSAMPCKNKHKHSTPNITKLDYFQILIAHLNKCKGMHIIVLDEIDLLKTKDQSILYNIFSLPTFPLISILLITISNSFNLDLDSKILSRQGNMKLLFKPYKNDQLYTILNTDKKQDKVTKNKKEFISRRVAAVSGDVRKAIELYKCTSKMNIEQISRKINEVENMLPKQYVVSLSDYHKIFMLKYYNNESVVDAFNNYNSFCTIKKLVNLDYMEFMQMVTFLISTGIVYICKERIRYIFIKEEIESYLKNDKILDIFI